METRTRFVFLMHPKEFKEEKAATGRLTHLCLARSEIHMGIGFDDHEAVRALISDRENYCVLLHPGREAVNLSAGNNEAAGHAEFRTQARTRRLVVFIIDATWALGRKMLKLSPRLQELPRVMFTPTAPSRFVIKQQPHPACLSTLEATHELLSALARSGLDDYPHSTQLLEVFDRMQAFQIQCAADSTLPGYRRGTYTRPATRSSFKGRSASRRRKLFEVPDQAAPPV